MNIISGSSHKGFSEKVAERLKISLTNVEISEHSDTETFFQIKESIREKHVFIIQTKNMPFINNNVMELLILIHTSKLASSRRITAVLPYFPYSRQDEKDRPRTPITAKLVANLLETAGANHVITMDLHSPQIQGFFNIPVDNLFAELFIMKYIKDFIPDWQKSVVVSSDAGGAKRATSLATNLNLDFAIIHKQRSKSKVIVSSLVGEVANRVAIIVDDIADSGQTLVKAAEKLKELKATKVFAFVTHGILSGKGCENINNSKLERLIVTNTLSQDFNKTKCKKLDVIDVSPVFAEAIRRTYSGESISYLFTNMP